MWVFGSKFVIVMVERLGVLEYKIFEGGFVIREYFQEKRKGIIMGSKKE